MTCSAPNQDHALCTGARRTAWELIGFDTDGGHQVRIKAGRVVMGTNGTPWSKGWSVTAEHMDDYMNRLEDQVIADEAGAAAAAIGSPQEGVR